MGIEDAEPVIHEFDSCKRAGSLTGLPWRSRAGYFATVTDVEKLSCRNPLSNRDWHTANKARSGLTPSGSEGIPSQVVAAPVGFMKSPHWDIIPDPLIGSGYLKTKRLGTIWVPGL
ncbi:hypothetical protein GCM10010869_75950 [Mesorhizobium tianshanense]|nr:hypothetical protein GCM10010869_75950 [Mesorhizobium tianshanense]